MNIAKASNKLYNTQIMEVVDLRQFKALALDFDGTLADTREGHDQARLEAFGLIAADLSDPRYANVPDEVHAEAHRHGTTPDQIIGWILTHPKVAIAKSLDDPIVKQTTDLKKELYNQKARNGEIPAVPGAAHFIGRAAVRFGSKMVISTTAQRDNEVKPWLIRHKVVRYFPDSRVVSAEDVTALKPDPEVYLVAASRAGVKPEYMVAVEDNPRGIEAAKRSGAKVIAIATTFKASELASLTGTQEPDYIIDGFDKLVA